MFEFVEIIKIDFEVDPNNPYPFKSVINWVILY